MRSHFGFLKNAQLTAAHTAKKLDFWATFYST